MDRLTTDFASYRWEHEGLRRYYCAFFQHDLLGWCLTLVWGGLHQSTGRIVHQPCDSWSAGLARMGDIHRRRQQRGYRLVVHTGAKIDCLH